MGPSLRCSFGLVVCAVVPACANYPARGQRFLHLAHTDDGPPVHCVRVADVETSSTARRPTRELAEDDAIADLEALAANRGGNYLRVECMTTLRGGNHGYRVSGQGAAYRCATSSPGRTSAPAPSATSAPTSTVVCEEGADGLATCRVAYGSSTDPFAGVVLSDDRGHDVAPPEGLPRVTCGVHQHDGFYLRETLGVGGVQLAGAGSGQASLPSTTIPTMVAVGFAPLHGLVVGAGGRVGLTPKHHSGPPARVSAIDQVGVLADWFPDPEGGAHVGVLAGAGILDVTAAHGMSSHFAPSGAVFVGYDLWVAPQSAVGLMLVVSGVVAEGTHVQINGTPEAFTPVAVSLEASYLFQ